MKYLKYFESIENTTEINDIFSDLIEEYNLPEIKLWKFFKPETPYYKVEQDMYGKQTIKDQKGEERYKIMFYSVNRDLTMLNHSLSDVKRLQVLGYEAVFIIRDYSKRPIRPGSILWINDEDDNDWIKGYYGSSKEEIDIIKDAFVKHGYIEIVITGLLFVLYSDLIILILIMIVIL